MELKLEPGKYVAAVSGGIDSVVMLNMLSELAEIEVVVAHFDHGIRDDSRADREFVARLALKYGMEFYYAEGKLGPKASEAIARDARYKFLHAIRQDKKALAILTAHHEDDRIETAYINLLRGTGRKGLSSLDSNGKIIRPLLHMNKHDIRKYALENSLEWREDSTNLNNEHLRNYLRNEVLPKLTNAQRKQLLSILDSAREQNRQLDKIIGNLFPEKNTQNIKRQWFIGLPHAVAREVLSHWLRSKSISFTKPNIERLVSYLKTLPVGRKADITGGWYFLVEKDHIRLEKQ